MSQTQTQAAGQTTSAVSAAQARRDFIAEQKRVFAERLEAELKEKFGSTGPKGKPNTIVNTRGGMFIGGTVALNAYITQLLYVIENAEDVLTFAIENVDRLSWRRKNGPVSDIEANKQKAVELLAKLQTYREMEEGGDEGGDEAAGKDEAAGQ